MRMRQVTTYIIILVFLSQSEKGVNRSTTFRGTVGIVISYFVFISENRRKFPYVSLFIGYMDVCLNG